MRIRHRNKKLLLLLVFLLLATADIFSQDYSYINYDTRDGLAGSVVYDAIQDKEGFMWFATENGLSRFDGKNFKTFTTKDGLPDNEVLKLFVDSKGRVWIMPFKPSLCYYFKGKIYNRNNDTLLAKIPLVGYAFDMAEDKSGSLFIVEDRRWHTISKNGAVRTDHIINDSDVYINALGVDENKEIEILIEQWLNAKDYYWIHSNDKHIRLDKIRPEWGQVSKSLINAQYVIVPRKGEFYLFFNRKSGEVIRKKLPSTTVSISYIDPRTIIINTRNGIQFYDPRANVFSKRAFADYSFTSAYEDKEHNLWLATTGSGVLMIPSFQFVNFSFPDAKRSSEISALSISENFIYAGGWNDKIWKSDIDTLNFSFQRLAFRGSKVISILPMAHKVVASMSTFYENPFTGHRLALALKSVHVGKRGIIFASHKEALLCKWTGEEEKIWEGRTTCAVEKDSGYYIGTLTGLYYKSLSGDTVDLARVSPVFSSRIVKLAISGDNILWVTTKGNGIAGYKEGKVLFHFTQANGLTSDNCTSLYLDRNIVWLGTNKGLNRIEIIGATAKITRFTISDGLPSDNINAVAASGRKVFVGSSKGLTYFEVDKISQASTCDLQLTGIYVANKYWGYDSTKFSLPHKSNDIRFEFSGLSFKSAGEIRYRYRLLGLQSEWRTTTENQLSFPSLSSGKYTLELVAINKYGVLSKMKQVSFVIEKLWWEKTWFRIGAALLLAAVVWSFISLRIKRIRRKEKEKTAINKRIADLEQKALRSQMNPHFIFNCLNSIQQYVAERDITGANSFITDFSRLIRMTLDLSTHPLINLADEVEYISTYLRVEKTRLEGVFDYRVHIDESLDLQQVQMPPLLLQPYLENSIRHGVRYKIGGDGLIQINITKKNNGVLIQIQDNGIGRQASKQYKSEHHIQYQSRGMTINEDRIKILNNTAEKGIELTVTDLYNSKEEAAGTQVDVYLPS